MRFDQLHHVGVVVDDIERAATQVERLYGTAVTIFDESAFPCRVDGVDQNPTQRLGLSVGKAPHLELLQAVRVRWCGRKKESTTSGSSSTTSNSPLAHSKKPDRRSGWAASATVCTPSGSPITGIRWDR